MRYQTIHYKQRFYFSALHYTNPERVNYAYKINELNNKWIDLGTQNFINLIASHPALTPSK
jgi:hypothetical protein